MAKRLKTHCVGGHLRSEENISGDRSCKLCRKERAQKWRDEHPEEHRENQRNYRLDNLEACRERNKKWNLENPELVAEYKRKYAEENPELTNESARKWRQTHLEHKRILTRQRRARIRGAEGTITKEEWDSVIEKFGPACLCCKEVKPLTMDHIIPIFCDGSHTIDNVQPLCLSCNSSKGIKTIDYRPIL